MKKLLPFTDYEFHQKNGVDKIVHESIDERRLVHKHINTLIDKENSEQDGEKQIWIKRLQKKNMREDIT